MNTSRAERSMVMANEQPHCIAAHNRKLCASFEAEMLKNRKKKRKVNNS